MRSLLAAFFIGIVADICAILTFAVSVQQVKSDILLEVVSGLAVVAVSVTVVLIAYSNNKFRATSRLRAE